MKVIRYESLGIYIYVKPKNQMEQKYSKWQHVYMHFRTFTQGKCTFGEINVDLCNKFREYLLTAPQEQQKNRKLHINSAANYWSPDDKPSAIKLV